MKPRLPLGVVALCLVVTSTGAAQDVTITDPAWVDEQNVAGEQPPSFKKRLRVTYPRELRAIDEIGYVMVVQSVSAKGDVMLPGRGASHPYFDRAVFEAAGRYTMRPAMKAGEPVDAISWFAVLFNPASAATKGPDATPRLLRVSPVVVPKGALGDAPPSRLPTVWGVVALDTSGQWQRVTLPPQAETFRSAIESALPNWSFAPARSGGQPIAAEVRVPFILQPGMGAKMVERATLPRPVKQVPPVYPLALRQHRMRGEVVLAFDVGLDGKVANVVVERTNNPAFNQPAIEALKKWRFEPGQRNGKPVVTRLTVPILFQVEGEYGGGIEAVTLRGGRDRSHLPPELQYDVPPKPRGTAMPVYPYEAAREGTRGRAAVAVLVGPTGQVMDVKVAEASEPEFGLALSAMAELLVFEPALRDGQPTVALLRVERDFSLAGRDSVLDREDRALLRKEEKAPEEILGGNNLDTPLRPLSRAAPVFPVVLQETHTTGQALIEFLVDERGRARLPRVVSATAPEFGYAAVQAVAKWEFEPPKSKGRSAVVRVQIPFEFKRHAAGEP